MKNFFTFSQVFVSLQKFSA